MKTSTAYVLKGLGLGMVSAIALPKVGKWGIKEFKKFDEDRKLKKVIIGLAGFDNERELREAGKRLRKTYVIENVEE